MNIDQSICILDTETTGTDTESDRIIQVAAVRIEPDETRRNICLMVDPGEKIPPEASAVHGIFDCDVVGQPRWPAAWARLAPILGGAVVCAYNARFDLGIIAAENKRHRISWTPPTEVIDPMVIFRQRVPHTLAGAVRHYLDQEHENAHDAMGDVEATIGVLDMQSLTYGLGNVAEMIAASTIPPDPRYCDSNRSFYWRHGAPVFGFGKHKGLPLARVDAGYLKWMLGQDYPEDTKDLVKRALRGETIRRPSTEAGAA